MTSWRIEMMPTDDPKLTGIELKIYHGTCPKKFVEVLHKTIGVGFPVRVRYDGYVYWGRLGRATDWFFERGCGDWSDTVKGTNPALFGKPGMQKK